MRGRGRSEALVLSQLLLSVGLPILAAQVRAQPLYSGAATAQTAVTPNYSAIYRKWLDEDVRYIISDEERSDFNKATTDGQRDKFVEEFWERRNPDPGSSENKFKEEHYRRLAYANQHFAARAAGYRTDRGRIYILYGPPKAVERHYSAAGSETVGSITTAGAIPSTGNSGTTNTSKDSERMLRSSLWTHAGVANIRFRSRKMTSRSMGRGKGCQRVLVDTPARSESISAAWAHHFWSDFSFAILSRATLSSCALISALFASPGNNSRHFSSAARARSFWPVAR